MILVCCTTELKFLTAQALQRTFIGTLSLLYTVSIMLNDQFVKIFATVTQLMSKNKNVEVMNKVL